MQYYVELELQYMEDIVLDAQRTLFLQAVMMYLVHLVLQVMPVPTKRANVYSVVVLLMLRMTLFMKDIMGVVAMRDITVGLNIREKEAPLFLLLHSREEPALLAQQASMTKPQLPNFRCTDISFRIPNQLKTRFVLLVPRVSLLVLQV